MLNKNPVLLARWSLLCTPLFHLGAQALDTSSIEARAGRTGENSYEVPNLVKYLTAKDPMDRRN
jgi:hypothetical protein